MSKNVNDIKDTSVDPVLLKEYADVLINVGLNIKKDQYVVVRAPIEAAAFVEVLAETAYEAGAKEVIVKWSAEGMTKLRYRYCTLDTLKEVPDYFTDSFEYYRKRGAAFLSLVGEDPELLKDADGEKVKAAITAKSLALKDYYEAMMRDEVPWNVAAVSVPSWSRAVFPELSDQEGVAALWNEILEASRILSSGSKEAWKNHVHSLKERSNYLNEKQYVALHYRNSLGTDLKIELPKNHIWSGGYGITTGGESFVANIPTEEIYTLPHRKGVNGIVYSSKPFNYAGNIIDEFWLNVEDGKIINFFAKKGNEVLEKLLDTDEGSRYFGEVALVPYHSPISNRNLLFFNTLFDENASCHLAIGKAYPTCLKNSAGKTSQELKELGVNDSIVHEDFMIGTEDLSIDGILEDGPQNRSSEMEIGLRLRFFRDNS